ncbi:hypothetical protein HispidOSU_026927, partial [Sigmodon hispidus]
SKLGMKMCVFTVVLNVSDQASQEMPRGAWQQHHPAVPNGSLENWQDPGHIKKE